MPVREMKLVLAPALLTMLALCTSAPLQSAPLRIELPAVGKVDPLYQSYNVEVVEVVGGGFWAPYPKSGDTPVDPGADPAATCSASVNHWISPATAGFFSIPAAGNTACK